MADVSIVYCRPCGYEPRAKAVADELRKRLNIDATLVPGTGGVFEIKVDGTVVAARSRGHFPAAPDVVAAVSEKLKPAAT